MIETQDMVHSQGDLKASAGIAARLRAARLSKTPLVDYPGDMPTTLRAAYDIQDQAIAEWPDRVRGWKVGRILGDLAQVHGVDRLIGPIFGASIQRAAGSDVVTFEAIAGGFCAVESEYVFELGQDADANCTDYTPANALELVKDLWTGIEIAGSPMAKINMWGPTCVVSDFGNNTGLILGQRMKDWRARLGQLHAVMEIDGAVAGTGSVASFPGGIEQSLAFALNCAAKRGMPLKSGMFVSTGAVTGVHDIEAAQDAHADFGEDGMIFCARQSNPSNKAK
jgi:2-keto-4-pentenoate hydratase